MKDPREARWGSNLRQIDATCEIDGRRARVRKGPVVRRAVRENQGIIGVVGTDREEGHDHRTAAGCRARQRDGDDEVLAIRIRGGNVGDVVRRKPRRESLAAEKDEIGARRVEALRQRHRNRFGNVTCREADSRRIQDALFQRDRSGSIVGLDERRSLEANVAAAWRYLDRQIARGGDSAPVRELSDVTPPPGTA